MGKKNRSEASRRAAARSPQRQPPPAVEQLGEATQIVGQFFGTTANCADAAGLLIEIGSRLGFKLRARPVSVQGMDAATGRRFVMGPKATKGLTPEERRELINLWPDGKNNGHMVLTSENPGLLLDPNMGQVAQYGIDAPIIVLRIQSTEPESGQWDARHAGLSLIYIVDDENLALMPRFEAARLESRALAASIAKDLRRKIPASRILEDLQRTYDYGSLSPSR
jgi:hypothetical protein